MERSNVQSSVSLPSVGGLKRPPSAKEASARAVSAVPTLGTELSLPQLPGVKESAAPAVAEKNAPSTRGVGLPAIRASAPAGVIRPMAARERASLLSNGRQASVSHAPLTALTGRALKPTSTTLDTGVVGTSASRRGAPTSARGSGPHASASRT